MNLADRNGEIMMANTVILTGMVLLEKGGDTNAKDNSGITVLMRAAGSRNLEAVKLLVDKEADVNAEDNKGQTALSLVPARNHPDVVQYLKSHDAK